MSLVYGTYTTLTELTPRDKRLVFSYTTRTDFYNGLGLRSV